MSEAHERDPAAALVDASGTRPARRRQRPSEHCPGRDGIRCGATPDKRVPSGGFGTTHEVCTQCGYEFKETPS